MTDDQEHLRLLSIFHYVLAGLTALFSCFPILHLGMGIAIFTGSFDAPGTGEAAPRFVGGLFAAFSALIMLMGYAMAFSSFLAGRYLAPRKNYIFCLVVAGIECIFVPVGTVLGVFTIVVLQRPTVKALFGRTDGASQAQASP